MTRNFSLLTLFITVCHRTSIWSLPFSVVQIGPCHIIELLDPPDRVVGVKNDKELLPIDAIHHGLPQDIDLVLAFLCGSANTAKGSTQQIPSLEIRDSRHEPLIAGT